MMSNGECTYCGVPFTDGKDILEYEDEQGWTYQFCNAECAGAHYVEVECIKIKYSKED